MSATIILGELCLSGDVGDLGYDDFFRADDVRSALAQMGRNKRAVVRLNSGGGSAAEGVAIANILAEHPGGVEVVVEGVAASAASVAACGAARIVMALGSVWMLHMASTLTIGTAEDHASAIAQLDVVNAGMASIYAGKSGVPVETVLDMMAAETWMTADDAVDAGFADAIVGQDEPRQPARFAYAARYRHPPAALLQRSPKTAALAFDKPLTPLAIAEMCLAAEQPGMTAALISENVTLAQAHARLDVMATIRPMMTMMHGRPGVTAALETEALSGRMTVAQVRERVFDAMADADAEIVVDNKRPTGSGEPDTKAIGKRNMLGLIEKKYGPEAAAKAGAKLNERKAG